MGFTKSYNLEQIKRIDEESIYKYYFPNFKLKVKLNSPFRTDNNPSFVFYKYNHSILWKDFNGKKGNVITFVMTLLNLDFNQTIKKIGNDFNKNIMDITINNVTNNIINNELSFKKNIEDKNKTIPKLFKPLSTVHEENRGNNFSKKSDNTDFKGEFREGKFLIQGVDGISSRDKEKESLSYIERDFNLVDFKIWESWGISKFILKKYSISSASNILYNNKIIRTYNLGNPIYIYKSFIEENFKSYRPFAYKPYKWIGSMSNSEILGIKQLNIKKNKMLNLLIICKSLKDVMLLTELGYSSICFGGESYYMNNLQYEILFSISNKIIYLGDLDYTGVKIANYYKKKYNIIPKFIDEKREKRRLDPTDFYLKFGKERLVKKLKNILN